MAEPSSLPAVRPVERVDAHLVEPAPDLLPSPAELDTIRTIALFAAKSGFFAGTDSPEKAAMQILAGREYGIGPWQSLSGMHVIKGKPTLSADSMAALIHRFLRRQRAGIFRVVENTAETCTVEYRRPEWAESSRITWTIAEARAAGLVVAGGNWIKFPRAMLRARAISEAARSGFPDVVAGLYDPDELDAPATRPVVTADATPDPTPVAVAVADSDGAGDPAAIRRRALSAIHAFVGDRCGGDPHRGVKLLQDHLYDGDASSLADDAAWPIERLRDFYRRLRSLHPSDLVSVATAEDDGTAPIEVKDDGAAPIEVGDNLVDPESGEILDYVDSVPILGPEGEVLDHRRITGQKAEELDELRRLARSCQSADDWRALASEVGTDELEWMVLAEEAQTTGTVNLLRAACRRANANTPELEGVFNQRAKAVRKMAEATTP